MQPLDLIFNSFIYQRIDNASENKVTTMRNQQSYDHILQWRSCPDDVIIPHMYHYRTCIINKWYMCGMIMEGTLVVSVCCLDTARPLQESWSSIIRSGPSNHLTSASTCYWRFSVSSEELFSTCCPWRFSCSVSGLVKAKSCTGVQVKKLNCGPDCRVISSLQPHCFSWWTDPHQVSGGQRLGEILLPSPGGSQACWCLLSFSFFIFKAILKS